MLAFVMPGMMEMVIIGIVAVLLFGSRLPKVAFSLGKSVTELKAGLSDTSSDFSSAKEMLEDQRTELGDAINNAVKQPVKKV